VYSVSEKSQGGYNLALSLLLAGKFIFFFEATDPKFALALQSQP
jgi:hypothetical protein